MGHWAAFDYERMAREAAKERDALHALLERRKKNPLSVGTRACLPLKRPSSL